MVFYFFLLLYKNFNETFFIYIVIFDTFISFIYSKTDKFLIADFSGNFHPSYLLSFLSFSTTYLIIFFKFYTTSAS